MKKISALIISVLLCAAAVLGLCACDKKDNGGKDYAIMLSYQSDIYDDSYNELCWQGLSSVNTIVKNYYEHDKSGDLDSFGSNLRAAVAESPDLIWVTDQRVYDVFKASAESHPEIFYAMLDANGIADIPSNMLTVSFEIEQAAFMAGYAAARSSQTGKVGFIGGVSGTVMDAFEYGFRAGVDFSNWGHFTVETVYLDSYTDDALAKLKADQMYAGGVDVIFQAAGAAGLGVIESAKENDKWVIGVDKDQTYLAPKNVLTSVVKKVDVAVRSITEKYFGGDDLGGREYRYGLENDGVGLVDSKNLNLNIKLVNDLSKLKSNIQKGEVLAPKNLEEYQEFVESLKAK